MEPQQAMVDRATEPPRSAFVVHCFREATPRRKRFISAAGWLALIAAWIGLGGFALVLTASRGTYARWTNVTPYLACAMLAAWVTGRLVNRFRARRCVRLRLTSRRKRLERIAAHADAGTRLPHRVVQLCRVKRQLDRRFRLTLRRPPAHGDLAGAITRIPKGIIVMGPYTYGGQGLIATVPWPFEPIDALDPKDTRQLAVWEESLRAAPQHIFEIDASKPFSGEAHDRRIAESAPGSRLKSVLRFIKRAAGAANRYGAGALVSAYAVLAGIGIFIKAVRGDTVSTLLVCGAIGAATAPLLVRTLWRRERAWLVPGGFVTCRHTIWRRRGKALYAQRGHTPLYVDPGEDLAFVRLGTKAQKLDFGWPHLVAWLASAPSPPVGAVQALVGEDVDVVLAG